MSEFLSGGIVLVLLGGLLAYLRQIPGLIWQQIRNRFVLMLHVDKSNTFYVWIENWLASQKYLEKCRNLTVSCFREDDNEKLEENERKTKQQQWKMRLSPAPGDHFLWYKGYPLWIRKSVEKQKSASEGMILGLFETMVLTFLTRDRGIIYKFLEEVKDFNIPPEDNRLAVYVAKWSSWRMLSLVSPRPVETVVLADGLLQFLIRDIESFLGSEDWYLKHAIPYRRGYLLYGPPGNGKSATVLALASHFHKDIYMLTVDSSMTDDRFTELVLDVPANAMFLIEDIDQAMKNEQNLNNSNKLTRSCLLNSLDGIAASAGRILFMTTNFVDELDEALKRPGRADVSVLIGAPTEHQMDIYLSKFFDADALYDIKLHLDGKDSMADLQAEIMKKVWGNGQCFLS